MPEAGTPSVAYHGRGRSLLAGNGVGGVGVLCRSMVSALWLAPLAIGVTIGPVDRVAANSARSGLRPRG
jgi:hypothetical protein